jgi:hypothetical protein
LSEHRSIFSVTRANCLLVRTWCCCCLFRPTPNRQLTISKRLCLDTDFKPPVLERGTLSVLLLFPWYADCTGLVVLRRVPEALSRSPIIRPEVVMIPAKDPNCHGPTLQLPVFL